MIRNVTSIIESIRSVADRDRVGVRAHGESLSFYPIAHCDQCERECEGPNAITAIFQSKADRNRSEQRADYIGALPELGACDALGGIAVCPECYRDEPAIAANPLDDKRMRIAQPIELQDSTIAIEILKPSNLEIELPAAFAPVIIRALMGASNEPKAAAIAEWLRVEANHPALFADDSNA